MIRPIEPNSSLIYAQSEFFQEEADTPAGKEGDRVMRGYYLLEEFSQPAAMRNRKDGSGSIESTEFVWRACKLTTTRDG